MFLSSLKSVYHNCFFEMFLENFVQVPRYLHVHWHMYKILKKHSGISNKMVRWGKATTYKIKYMKDVLQLIKTT